MTKLVIFTDLDGTLLDHHSYSYQAALPGLELCQQYHYPVIPTTSKTRAEVNPLRHELGLNSPFIVENGAAIYIPQDFFPTAPPDCQWQNGYWVKTFGVGRAHWLDILASMQPKWANYFNHFAQMSTKEIMACTGLHEQQAVLAAQREFAEPVLWLGDPQLQTQFISELKAHGASPIQGTRFIHVCAQVNKGQALTWLMHVFKQQFPQDSTSSVALGDGQNDIDMLAIADIPVRIKSPVQAFPQVNSAQTLIDTSAYGPAGWTEALTNIINTHKESSHG